MQLGLVMPKSTIEWFDLSSECLALVMQSCGDQIFIGFEKVCTITHGWQVLQLFEKLASCLDRSTTTDKAKHFGNSRIHCYPDPAFRFFLATKLQNSSTLMKEQACVLGWLTGKVTAQQPGQANGRPFCDVPRGFCQWLWESVLRDVAFEPFLGRRDLCLCALSERFVGRLGNGSVGLLGSYQKDCSLVEHSEDIASLDL